MSTNVNSHNEEYSSGEALIASVAPADLKTVWTMNNEFQIRHPGQQVSISLASYARACSPQADIRAVISRISMLEEVQYAAEAGHFRFPWIKEGQPEEIVFKIIATIPMAAPQPGVVHEGLPIDVEKLITQIENESKLRN